MASTKIAQWIFLAVLSLLTVSSYGLTEAGKKLLAERLARTALTKWADEHKIENALKLDNISIIKKHGVLAELWKVKFTVHETSCSKDVISTALCATKSIRKCSANIRVSDLLFGGAPEQSIETICSPPNFVQSHNQQHLIGGEDEADVEEESVKKAVAFAVKIHNLESNSLYTQVLANIDRATKQVVNGVLYKIRFHIISTKCRKNRQNVNDECLKVTLDSPIKECYAEILHQAWLKEKYSFLRGKSVQCLKWKLKARDVNTDLFETFKKEHGKTYSSIKEEEMRHKIFYDNMKKIEILQAMDKGSAIYGPTKFADLTEEEFGKFMLPSRWNTSFDARLKEAVVPNVAVPTSFDWRTHNAVTEVKNQGMCGSCWAFSTTGNIEGQYAIKHGKLLSFSEQELVDCDKIDEGCNGGLPSNAYEAIKSIGGLETESQYPYEGSGEKCKFKKSDAKVDVSGGLNITSNEKEMAQWLVSKGPISIGINAFAMQFYMGGVAHPWKIFCNPSSLDHGVLIVGYGVHKRTILSDEPYWIVKNSWGKTWGEHGYYLVYRGAGVCGLNKMCSSAIIY